MTYVTNPSAPPYDVAQKAASRLARILREDFPEWKVRIEESIRGRFEVTVEVPFRVEHPTWEETVNA